MSQTTAEFIKKFEGCKLTAYQDQAGIWTIGWGTTRINGAPVVKGMVIPQYVADHLLNDEIDRIFSQTAQLLKVPLNQNQADATASFAYNAGIGALASSALLKRINTNPLDPLIRDAFMMWTKIHVDGKLVPNKGLFNRRKAEANLYFSL